MRLCVFLLVIFGFLNCRPCLGAENVATLSGEELFRHEWAHYSKAERKEIDTKTELEAVMLRREMDPEERERLAQQLAEEVEQRNMQAAMLRQGRGGRGGFPAAIGFSAHGSGDGLGPMHNANSCADCHPQGGAAGVERNVILLTVDPRSPAVMEPESESGRHLIEVLPGLLSEFGSLNIETVLHDRSTHPGYEEIRGRLADYVPGGIDDAWFQPAKRTVSAIADRPVIAGRHEDVDFYLSQRNPPALFGLGLIDMITPRRLEALAVDQAKDGRVSGRVAQKFGWRGQIGSVLQFVGEACAGELGLTSDQAIQSGDPANTDYRPPGYDVSFQEISKLASFVASVPSPLERGSDEHSEDDTYHGESVFNSIGCADCHVADVYPAMNVFSDFLLHDMGERLQAASAASVGTAKVHAVRVSTYESKGPVSGVPEYYSGSFGQGIPYAEEVARPDQPQFPRGARPIPAIDKEVMTWNDLQREWRTPPLWGVADTGPYLHDGRAKTLKDAILWHGGEAQDSTDLFIALSPDDKMKLLAFLSTLRAPTEARLAEKQSAPLQDGDEEAEAEALEDSDASLSGPSSDSL